MKALVLFAITWITASVVLFYLVDYNTYVFFPNGNVILKERAGLSVRLINSILVAAIYSVVNTMIILCCTKLFNRSRKRV